MELDTLLKQTAVRNALSSASPALLRALEPDAVRRAPESAALAAMRYVERMRGRATPFGLCAGYSLGRVTRDETTTLELAPREAYRAVLRVDVDAITAIVRAEARRAPDDVRYVCSQSILWFDDLVKVARRGPDGKTTYADISRSPAIDLALRMARAPVTTHALREAVRPFADDAEEASAFVSALVSEGLLVPEHCPPIGTEDEIRALEGFDGLKQLASNARAARSLSLEQDVGPPVETLESALRAHQAEEGSDEKHDRAVIFDLVKPMETGRVGQDVIRELRQLIAVLQRVAEPMEDKRLRALSKHILDHYEGREVPLVEALDPGRGFDFPVEPDFSRAGTGRKEPRPNDGLRLELFSRSLEHHLFEVKLEDEDLPAEPKWELPSALTARFRIARGARGPVLHDLLLLGPPGTALFGRATAFMPSLREATEQWLAAQAAARPDADIADLAYFIPGRTAAAVQYPALQRFEIPLSARAGKAPEQVIDVSDLFISVRGDRLMLRSATTGREVLPWQTNALNGDRPMIPSLVRFLHAYTGVAPIGHAFSWRALADASFLPRVRYRDHVLSYATWTLGIKATRAIRDARSSAERRYAVESLRERHRLPRHISFHENADHFLAVDLDDPLSVEAWLDVALKRSMESKPWRILEAFGLEDSAVRGPEGRFQHEILIPLVTNAPARAEAPPSRPVLAPSVTFDRVCPGGDVLYAKIYGDPAELIPLLLHLHETVLEDAMTRETVARWFFLPYRDPDPHVRLRCMGSPAALYGDVLPRLRDALDPYVRRRTISRWSLETYDRETYRYGGEKGLSLCEEIFWASSEAALALRREEPMHSASDAAEARSFVHSLAGLLSAIEEAPPKAAAHARRTAERYQRAPDVADVRRRAGDHFRQNRDSLLRLDEMTTRWSAPWAKRVAHAAAALREACEQGTVHVPFDALVSDLLHVHSIRVLTPWCEQPHLEEIGYLVLGKLLSYRAQRDVVAAKAPIQS
ncbi:Lanthionine biosynthesis protein LanB [Minicystis rosea]|nr:Lanthionine biosynthesis protein LanB [Minicystis rosea]